MPQNFKNVSEKDANCLKFLIIDVNMPTRIIITPWPSAKASNKQIEKIKFALKDATAITDAKIGVEQGDAARANIAPIKNGYKILLLLLFWGNSFINTGTLISTTPSKFSPISIIKEVNIKTPTGPSAEAKTFPVKAQITPIMLNTTDMPKTKKNSWDKVVFKSSLSYPPI